VPENPLEQSGDRLGIDHGRILDAVQSRVSYRQFIWTVGLIGTLATGSLTIALYLHGEADKDIEATLGVLKTHEERPWHFGSGAAHNAIEANQQRLGRIDAKISAVDDKVDSNGAQLNRIIGIMEEQRNGSP
jgi:hypothetical protein